MKSNLNLFGFILLTGILASCNYAKFDRLPGVKQEANSPEIQGTFEVQEGFFTRKKTDSFSVVIDDHSIKEISKDGIKESRINIDYYLYQLNNYFLIGTSDPDFKAVWNITVIEPVPNGFKAYAITENKPDPNQPSRIQPYLPEREMPVNMEPIMTMPGTAPTPPLMDAGGQSMLKYFTMNDDLFLNYFEREIKGKDYLLLKKIKPTQKAKKK